MPRPTQLQLYYQAERKAAEVNETFLELVADGMTREELQACIDRRPWLWNRFANWLVKLPSGQPRDAVSAGVEEDPACAS